MRHALVVVVLAVDCGEVQKADPDAGAADASQSTPLDASVDSAPCATFGGAFTISESGFADDVGMLSQVDFETRGDGVTKVVTAGTPVPPDEYVACCGIRIEFSGTDATGEVIWAGNTMTGFSVRATCQNAQPCTGTAGLLFTFTTPATAVGAEYAGGTSITVSDPQGVPVATNTQTGSGINFLGYEAKVQLGRAQFSDSGGEDVAKLLYHRCQ